MIGTCNRFAKYLDTWARQSDAMKQKIIAFLSNPLDPSITYQDIDQMPLAAFAVANVSKDSFTGYCVTRMVSHTYKDSLVWMIFDRNLCGVMF